MWLTRVREAACFFSCALPAHARRFCAPTQPVCSVTKLHAACFRFAFACRCAGVRVSHTEFEGRAIHSSSVVGDASDCNGHGTHVAGIVGGRLSGVAKGVTIYAVKVLGCSSNGDVSSVVTGLDNAITEVRDSFVLFCCARETSLRVCTHVCG